MDAVSAYSFGNLGWLGLQAFPLIVWPRFISSLLREDGQNATGTLEGYYARSLGFALLSLGLIIVVLSGALPLAGAHQQAPQDTPSPYADAAIFISTLHHAAAAFHCYSRAAWTHQTAYTIGALGSSVFACYGLWCVMFAGTKGRRSRHLGLDKNTSGFPFKNSESYRSKKKGM